jgi:hypothetical protein
MTKSATREAADKVTFTQTEVTSAVALKAPIASPVFTGNVGIGVTPESDLNTATYSNLRIGLSGLLQANKSGHQTLLGSNYKVGNLGNEYISTGAAARYMQAQGAHYFSVAPSGSADAAVSLTNAMSIQNNGQVQIGSPSASAGWLLNLKALSGGSTVRLQSNNGYDAISFLNASGSQCGWIRSNASSVAYNSSSDYRLKTDVQPMTGATDRVKLLKPCNFEWIVDGTRVDGFLAHEAQEVVPESVTGTKDAMMDEEYEVTAATDTEAAVMGTRSVPDMQGIDQSKLVPLLTATIQELIARIEALEGE